jgi:alkyl sulfatase BDS1-like metallo-beta-lactamase superfamily hydrolase
MQQKQYVAPRLVFMSTLVLGLAGQVQAQDAYVFSAEQKEATNFTKDANQAVYKALDFENKVAFEDSRKGLIAPLINKSTLAAASSAPPA